MRLYLMQHGNPVMEEVDPERPLSDQGKSDVRKVAEFLKRARVERPSRCGPSAAPFKIGQPAGHG